MAKTSDYYTKSFSVHKIKEKELYEFLQAKSETENIAIYIRNLIKMDMQGLISRSGIASAPLISDADVNSKVVAAIKANIKHIFLDMLEDEDFKNQIQNILVINKKTDLLSVTDEETKIIPSSVMSDFFGDS